MAGESTPRASILGGLRSPLRHLHLVTSRLRSGTWARCINLWQLHSLIEIVTVFGGAACPTSCRCRCGEAREARDATRIRRARCERFPHREIIQCGERYSSRLSLKVKLPHQPDQTVLRAICDRVTEEPGCPPRLETALKLSIKLWEASTLPIRSNQ